MKTSKGSVPWTGIFVAGSIARGMVADGYRPARSDVIGALVCPAGMAVIMYAPRAAVCRTRGGS
ncbi:drug/metabolite transporter superfamily protein YnfA [Streptomyces sp. B3I8]|nr:drug/metabolite transporter superfamily protein YnfA [Streptomyces sp. B3I8]